MVQFKAVDAKSPYMQRLIEYLPSASTDPPQLQVEHERWITEGRKIATEDVFLSAPTRADLELFVESVPSLTLPDDRELAFGRIDSSGRWRTYVVHATAALDGSDIVRAELTRHAANERILASVDFTPSGAKQFANVTEKMIGDRLAVLLDGTVVAAPVIMGEITGGRAEISAAR